MREGDGTPGRQPARFLALYALAAAGGSASYAPFLTIVLPHRVAELAGADAIRVLSYTAFVGAVAASLSSIAFGWLSDRTGNRKGWILAGLAASSALLVGMRFVTTLPQLLAMIFAWQVALNMMLNPLSAWAGDCVPDGQKGLLGGLLSFAPGVGALVGAFVTIPGLAGPEGRLNLIAALVIALVLPALLWGRPYPMPHLTAEPAEGKAADAEPLRDAIPAVWRMWLARLLLQIAEAALFAFLYLWLRGLDGSVSDNRVATLFTFVLFASVPVSLAAGRWSDRTGRPIRPLALACAAASLGLLAMATAGQVTAGMASYLLFGVAAAVFLALHSSQTLRVLPHPRHRGRDLGFFNLTNTIPSLVMPGLTLTLIPWFGFAGLFVLLACFAAAAGLLLMSWRKR